MKGERTQTVAGDAVPSAPTHASRAEEEDEEHNDDAASVAAHMWFQDEPQWDAQHQDEQQTMGVNISHASHSNTDANPSVRPQTYTPADFPTEWFKDDADVEYDLDVDMGDMHLN